MKLSIIVTTYNRTDALNAVLAGLARQVGVAHDQWEVLVADDGSGPATSAVVQRWQACFPCSLLHVWHEDAGFRAAAIRNRSAMQARGEYLIFLDGDCIPFPDFATQTLALAERGWFVAGNRVLLSEQFTQGLLLSQDPAAPVRWSWARWSWARLRGEANRALPWLRISMAAARKRRATRWHILKSCNMGVWRADFDAVNGFDETFSGWGHEDSDLAVRLIRAGILLKDGRYAVPVLHLWHRENDRSKQAANWAKLESTLNGQHTRAQLGLSQYRASPEPAAGA